MYYMLEYYSLGKRPVRTIATFPRVDGVATWLSGTRFTSPVPQPLLFPLEPVEGGDAPEPQILFNSTILVMREDLAAALRESGANNFDAYRAVLEDPTTGKRWTNYLAVNIIGAIAAADLNQSVFTSAGKPLLDADFESVTIDPTRTHDMSLFRLAECMTALVVSERVKEHLLARGFDSLTFVPPEEWIG